MQITVAEYGDRKFPKMNFIGNKGKISDWIFDSLNFKADTFFDPFSGGCSVSFEAKRRGFQVITNDVLRINYMIGRALIKNKNIRLTENDVDLIFQGKPTKGFMYRNYANKAFYSGECMELDLYRKNILKLSNQNKMALALILIRRAMIRKMPYSRFTIPWKKVKELRNEQYSYEKYGRMRAYHNQSFKEHFLANLDDYNNAVFDNGYNNKSYNTDAFRLLGKVKTDIIYLDPPYVDTMNNYHGFYGILDNFIMSRIIPPFKHNFIRKETSLMLFDKLFSNLDNYKYILLSYNNNSYPNIASMKKLVSKYFNDFTIHMKKHDYKVSGSTMKSKNKECLFIIKNRKNKTS